jgi:hypothetical protein
LRSNTFKTDYVDSPLVIEHSKRLFLALQFILKLILIGHIY